MGAIYKVDKMGGRADYCSIPIFALKKGEIKSFYIYCAFFVY